MKIGFDKIKLIMQNKNTKEIEQVAEDIYGKSNDLMNLRKKVAFVRGAKWRDVQENLSKRNDKLITMKIIWEYFKTVVTWLIIVYIFLFVFVGGEFSFNIKWENLNNLWKLIIGN